MNATTKSDYWKLPKTQRKEISKRLARLKIKLIKEDEERSRIQDRINYLTFSLLKDQVEYNTLSLQMEDRWVVERSSGYMGWRCRSCAEWVYFGQKQKCKCDKKP